MSMKSKYKSSYKRRSTGKTKRGVLLTLSVILFCGVIGAGIFLIFGVDSKQSQSEDTDQLTVYAAKEDIERGHKITASQLEEITITPEMPVEYYCNATCIEQVAAVDVPKGMPILHNMLCKPNIEAGQREVECEIVSLSDNLVDNDYVDIRIMMPNGEDYIVLAKKSIHDLTRSEENKEDRCYLWMSEDEILYYSAAIVDAYLYPGSSLYTTRYIEPAVQEASITTYVPSIGTITMMKENPNLLQEAISHLKETDRKQLENRLTYYLNKDIREVLWKEAEIQPEDGVVNPGSKPENDFSQQSKEAISVKDSNNASDEKKTDKNKDEEESTEDTMAQEDQNAIEDKKDLKDALSVFVEDSKTKEEKDE